jgi:hypothetical protein
MAGVGLEDEQRWPTEATVNALIGVLPSEWTAAVLRVERRSHPDGSEGMLHGITSPAGRKELVEPDDALYLATAELAALFERHGRPWKAAVIRLDENASGGWGYEISYRY